MIPVNGKLRIVQEKSGSISNFEKVSRNHEKTTKFAGREQNKFHQFVIKRKQVLAGINLCRAID